MCYVHISVHSIKRNKNSIIGNTIYPTDFDINNMNKYPYLQRKLSSKVSLQAIGQLQLHTSN